MLVCLLSPLLLVATWVLVMVVADFAIPSLSALDWKPRMALLALATLIANVAIAAGVLAVARRFNVRLREVSAVRLTVLTGLFAQPAGAVTLYLFFALMARMGASGGGGGHGAGFYFLLFFSISAVVAWLSGIAGAALATRPRRPRERAAAA